MYIYIFHKVSSVIATEYSGWKIQDTDGLWFPVCVHREQVDNLEKEKNYYTWL